MTSKEVNLYQRINAVMRDVITVEKGVTISMANGRGYNAVSHDDVTRLLHLPIANYGIVLSPSVVQSDLKIIEKKKEWQGKEQITNEYMASVIVELTATNSENPEEKLSIRMPAIAFDSGDKCFGKAISMATKYCYLKLFMLESVDEEESVNGASYEKRNVPAKPKQEASVRVEAPKAERPKNEKDMLGDITRKLGEELKGKQKEEQIKIMKEKYGISGLGEIMSMKPIELNVLWGKLFI